MARKQPMAVTENAVLNMHVLADFIGLAARGVAAALMTGVILAALVLLFNDAAGAVELSSMPGAQAGQVVAPWHYRGQDITARVLINQNKTATPADGQA